MVVSLAEAVLTANTGLDAIKRAPIVEEDTGIKCLRIQDVSQSKKYDHWGFTNVDEKNFKKFQLLKDDILIARTGGSIGVNLIIKEKLKSVFNNGLIRIRIDTENYDPRFLYYILQSNIYRGHINAIAFSTSTQPNMKIKDFLKVEFKKVELVEQKAIAHILGTLDNKIELNCKMNETLEQMAQALFKSWFVNFDPVLDNAIANCNSIPDALKLKVEKRKEVISSGNYKTLPKEVKELFPSSFEFNDELEKWIPEGWHIGKMEEIVDVKYGKDHKKLEEGNFPCYGSGGIMRYVDSTLCNEESVLIPRKGTLSNIMYVRNPFWSVDTMFFTEFKQPNYVKYLFYFLQKFNFTEMNVGSAVPSMTTKVLNSLNLLQPSEQVLEFFDEKVEYFLSKKEANEKQNESLIKQRDVLLPQLISGKLRISDKEMMITCNLK